jgi:hypothetical protein
MIAESEKTSYPGVVCSHCGAVIVVTGKLAKLRDRTQDSAAGEPHTRSFPIRCKACEKETVSSVEQIKEFEGKPTIRRHWHGKIK